MKFSIPVKDYKILKNSLVNDYGDVLLTNKMYNGRITVILMKGWGSAGKESQFFVALFCSIRQLSNHSKFIERNG